jgi:hypothetical protein
MRVTQVAHSTNQVVASLLDAKVQSLPSLGCRLAIRSVRPTPSQSRSGL